MAYQSQFGSAGAVLEAVAAKEGTDPTALTPPLATIIDPVALDRLLESGSPDADLSVRFNYRDHEIVVNADGEIKLN